MGRRLTPGPAAGGFIPPFVPVDTATGGRSGGAGERQAEAHAGPHGGLDVVVVDDPDAPAVGLDDGPRDREAEARAAVAARGAAGALLEGLEDPLAVGGGDPRA